MALIEIHGSYGQLGRRDSDAGWYWFALARGWHVSPVMDWDWHDWTTNQGVLGNPLPGADYDEGRHFLPGQRSLVLATTLGPRTSRGPGSRAGRAPPRSPTCGPLCADPATSGRAASSTGEPGQTLRCGVDAGSPTEQLWGVEIIGDNGLDGHEHYYGDNPDWNTYTASSRRPTSSSTAATWSTVTQPASGSMVASGTTGRPKGTVVARAALSGHRSQATIKVKVPTKPSPRPDGRHFFYAIVYAGKKTFPARAWTGPLLTQARHA